MSTIRELLDRIPARSVLSISPFDTVYSAIALMSENSVGALLVMEGNKIVGIVTERDYACKIVLRNRPSGSTTVSEIMSSKVLYVTSVDTAEACMALMVLKQVGYLPVLDRGELLGLVSMGDLARAIVADHEILIGQLCNYIDGEKDLHIYPEQEPATERWT